MPGLTFTLIGNDRLSSVLRGAGNAAVGLHRRLDSVGLGASSLSRVAGAGLSAAGSIAKIGGVAGAAIPAATGLVSTLLNVAPAAGVAATGVVALATANAALKIGMMGVGDALASAFDPEKAAEFNEAMSKLAPNARGFVQTLRGLKPAFDDVRLAVQDRLFKGLGETLRTTARAVRGDLRGALLDSAETLNLMGRRVLNTATGLSKSGALGTALDSATDGLRNMSALPGVIVQGLVQVGAAAGPSFERLTAMGGSALDQLGQRMANAFASGRMQSAIEGAISLIGDLIQVGKNIGTVIGNVFSAASASGDSFVSGLLSISGALADISGSPAVQGGLQAVAGVMTQLATTGGSLLAPALEVIGRVFQELGPPVEGLIRGLGQGLTGVLDVVGPLLVDAAGALGGLLGAVSPLLPHLGTLVGVLGSALQPVISALGPLLGAFGSSLGLIAQALAPVLPVIGQLVGSLGQALTPIVAALGPVLGAVAGVIGELAGAITPLLPVVGGLVAQLGPALTPVISTIGTLIGQLAPLAADLVSVLAGALQPVLAVLPTVLQPILGAFTELTGELVPILQQLLVDLTPAITTVSLTLADLLVALSPVIAAGIQFVTGFLQKASPVIRGVSRAVGALASALSGALSIALNTIVKPALRAVTWLLKGDFTDAFDAAKRAVGTALRWIGEQFATLPGRVWNALSGLASRLWNRMANAGGRLVDAARDKIGDAVAWIGRLPGRAASALGNLGSRLAGKMTDAGGRLVSAARNKIGDAVSEIRRLPSRVRDGLGNLDYLLINAGKDVIRGFISGIRSMIPDVSGVLGGITDMIPDIKGPPAKDAKLLYKSGQLVIQGFIRGLDGSAAKVSELLQKLTDAIPKDAERRLDNRLRAGTARLKGLAKERAAVLAQIAAAHEFAGQVRSSAKSSAALSTITAPEGGRITGGKIRAGLKDRLGQIRKFTGMLRRLSDRGLAKGLLRQILEMGPDEGYEYARALDQATPGMLRAINRAQGDINQASSTLGAMGADRLYDAGKNAGKGLLSGLKSQQKAIERLMLNIARDMQGAIRKALGIRSPSTVMAGLGRHTTEGLALGITGQLPVLQAAMNQVSATVTSGVGTPTVPGLSATGLGPAAGGTVVNITVDARGAMDPAAVAREIQRLLKRLKRDYGLNVNLGTA